jgi:hypothetical protein
VSISADTSEHDLLSGTLLANTLGANNEIEVVFYGYFRCQSTPTYTIKLYFGTQVVFGPVINCFIGGTNQPMNFRLHGSCGTGSAPGASTSVICSGTLDYQDRDSGATSGSQVTDWGASTAFTFASGTSNATNADMTIKVTGQLSATATENFIGGMLMKVVKY